MPQNFKYNLVPGPTKVHPSVSLAYSLEYPSSDLEDDFFEDYQKTTLRIQNILNTNNDILIQTGEAMLGLWGALKSCLKSQDKVLILGGGIYGDGFADMVKSIGASTIPILIEWENPDIRPHLSRIADIIQNWKPTLVTCVHCDTPSGSINPFLKEIGDLISNSDSLFCVDMVSSFSASWNIDLALFGSQKALCCPPEFSFVSVSKKAWKIIERVKYIGYDAFLPYKDCVKNKDFPYTPSWRALGALNAAFDLIEAEGLENVYKRHLHIKKYTIERIQKMGLELFIKNPILRSPTITAVYIPEGWNWNQLNERLKKNGVAVGSSYLGLKSKIFRIGHMGIQADIELLTGALDILENILKVHS